MRSRDYIERKAQVMSQALDNLSRTYGGRDGRNPIGEEVELPSEAEVLRVLTLLDDIFYPGYRSERCAEMPVETLVIERLAAAYDLLYRQVRLALPLRWMSEAVRSGDLEGPSPLDAEAISSEAERVVGAFFERLPEIREALKLDVIAAYKGDPAAKSYAEVILSYPGVRAVTTYRVAHQLYRLDVPLIPRLMTEHVHSRTGIEIHPGATIGESFFIDHGTGVVIGETAEIGKRVKLYQGVTLGAFSFKLDESGHPVKGGKRHPTIEDDVVIYAGTTILGGETVIGRGSVIGSNVWLTRSVPPGTSVMYTRENYTLKNGAT
ncbi:MAG: serine O-acetyltransferase EpsC [Armatimonadota bacterium]